MSKALSKDQKRIYDEITEKGSLYANGDVGTGESFCIKSYAEKYQFQEEDLVVCEPEDGKQNDDKIYARVVRVDRENDIVCLDKYTCQGRLHSNLNAEGNGNYSSFSLSEAEQNGRYRLMNDDEIKAFAVGIDHLMNMVSKSDSDYASIKITADTVFENFWLELCSKTNSGIMYCNIRLDNV